MLKVDAVRGALAGLAGTGVAVGITMLVRHAMGLATWESNSVLTGGIFTGVVTYLIAVGVFKHWVSWATGARQLEDTPKKKGIVRYFSVDTNHTSDYEHTR